MSGSVYYAYRLLTDKHLDTIKTGLAMDTPSSKLIYLAGSPLLRPRIGKLAVALLIVLVLLGAFGLVRTLPGYAEANLLGVYFLALLTAIWLSLPAIALLWYLDRREREPLWLFIGALLWGAVVANGLSLILNTSGITFLTTSILGLSPGALEGLAADEILSQLDLGPNFFPSLAGLLLATFQGAFVEEVTKGIALLLLAWLMRSEFNGVRDGIIYGGLVGLGFNLTATATYATNAFLDSGTVATLQQLISRFVFLGLDSHFLYTALLGVGLGLAVQSRRQGRAALYALGAVLLAIFAHAIHRVLMPFAFGMVDGLLLTLRNGAVPGAEENVSRAVLYWLTMALATLLVQLFPFLLLLVALIQSEQWELRTIREQLADEVGRAITAREYQQLQEESLWVSRRIKGYSRRVSNAIVNAQNKLALRKWEVKRAKGNFVLDPLVRAWRDRIDRLR
ncbi:MAG: hypothetical protein Kow00121_19750 [Elainellaceae cyanobacterium]